MKNRVIASHSRRETGKRPHQDRAKKVTKSPCASLQAELNAVRYAAHMPADYQFGLASWINQKLYAAWIGAEWNPEVLEEIRKGHIIFPNSPALKVYENQLAEIGRLQAELTMLTEQRDTFQMQAEDAVAQLVVVRQELKVRLEIALAERDAWKQQALSVAEELLRQANEQIGALLEEANDH